MKKKKNEEDLVLKLVSFNSFFFINYTGLDPTWEYFSRFARIENGPISKNKNKIKNIRFIRTNWKLDLKFKNKSNLALNCHHRWHSCNHWSTIFHQNTLLIHHHHQCFWMGKHAPGFIIIHFKYIWNRMFNIESKEA